MNGSPPTFRKGLQLDVICCGYDFFPHLRASSWITKDQDDVVDEELVTNYPLAVLALALPQKCLVVQLDGKEDVAQQLLGVHFNGGAKSNDRHFVQSYCRVKPPPRPCVGSLRLACESCWTVASLSAIIWTLGTWCVWATYKKGASPNCTDLLTAHRKGRWNRPLLPQKRKALTV